MAPSWEYLGLTSVPATTGDRAAVLEEAAALAATYPTGRAAAVGLRALAAHHRATAPPRPSAGPPVGPRPPVDVSWPPSVREDEARRAAQPARGRRRWWWPW